VARTRWAVALSPQSPWESSFHGPCTAGQDPTRLPGTLWGHFLPGHRLCLLICEMGPEAGCPRMNWRHGYKVPGWTRGAPEELRGVAEGVEDKCAGTLSPRRPAMAGWGRAGGRGRPAGNPEAPMALAGGDSEWHWTLGGNVSVSKTLQHTRGAHAARAGRWHGHRWVQAEAPAATLAEADRRTPAGMPHAGGAHTCTHGHPEIHACTPHRRVQTSSDTSQPHTGTHVHATRRHNLPKC
jgi:hypothetical protein